MTPASPDPAQRSGPTSLRGPTPERRRLPSKSSSTVRALVLALLWSHLPSTAVAQGVQLGKGTISIGDSVQTLTNVAGKPDRIRPFPGSPSFTVYEYPLDGRQVNVSVKDGKVTGIADNVIVSKPGPAAMTGVELNGSTIITGDTLAKLLQSAGKPDRIRSVVGAPEKSVYEYSSDGRQVTVTVTNGTVTGTSETRVTRK